MRHRIPLGRSPRYGQPRIRWRAGLPRTGACSSLTVSGIRFRPLIGIGAPARTRPGRRRYGSPTPSRRPGRRSCSHTRGVQKKHSPQKVSTLTVTRSPGFAEVTAGPTRSTTTHRLVADGNARHGAGHAAVLDMQVAGADTAQRHAHNRIARIFQLRLRFVQQLELSSFDISIGLHG